MKTKEKNSYELVNRSSSYEVKFKGKDYMVVYEHGDNGYYSFEIYDSDNKKIVNKELSEWFTEVCSD